MVVIGDFGLEVRSTTEHLAYKAPSVTVPVSGLPNSRVNYVLA